MYSDGFNEGFKILSYLKKLADGNQELLDHLSHNNQLSGKRYLVEFANEPSFKYRILKEDTFIEEEWANSDKNYYTSYYNEFSYAYKAPPNSIEFILED